MRDFAKLIFAGESTLLMGVNNKKLTKENLIKLFLSPNIERLYDVLANDILLANLKGEHFYTFELTVHAQKMDIKK